MYNLSWQEAQQVMSEGKKVKHRHFCSGEWFEMKDGLIVCEGGYDMTNWYIGDDWQKSGWAIVQ